MKAFTHTLLAAAALLMAAPASAGLPKLILASDDGNYSARLSLRVQPRFEYLLPDEGDEEAHFGLQRARLKLSGNIFSPALGYSFQADFGRGNVTLKDFYIDYFVNPWFGVRVGQFKKLFSRQQLISSGNLEFVDRALTDKAFNAGRDIGVALMSDYTRSSLEWGLGVFNGTGEGTVPDLFEPVLVARVGYNSDGKAAYSEGDLVGDKLVWGVAASAQLDLGLDQSAEPEADTQAEVDFILKTHGFATTGGFYVGWTGGQFSEQEYQQWGMHVQASYVFLNMLQPALRYARLSPTGADNDVQEIQGAFSVYVFGHSLKWQTDVTGRMFEAGGTDILVRSQVQLAL